METGIVKSYSKEKRFGFISDDCGNSYFFHISNVSKTFVNEIAIGCSVSFNAIPKPKGMTAVDIKPDDSLIQIYEDIDDSSIIVSKSERCGKGNIIIHTAPSIYVGNRNPDAGVYKLKHQARKMGCNAILNLNRGRRTGSDWGSNYKYTIHTFSATPALIKRISYTRDPNVAKLNEQQIKDQIKKIQQSRTEGSSLTDENHSAAIFFFFLMFFIFIFLSLTG